MNGAVVVGFALFVIGALLFLVEIWAHPWDPETFFKLLMSDGVLLAIVVIGGFIFRERRASKDLRDRKLD